MNPEEAALKDKKSKQAEDTETEVVEEIVEVDSPEEAGTEIIEEVIEVDENGKVIHEEKK